MGTERNDLEYLHICHPWRGSRRSCKVCMYIWAGELCVRGHGTSRRRSGSCCRRRKTRVHGIASARGGRFVICRSQTRREMSCPSWPVCSRACRLSSVCLVRESWRLIGLAEGGADRGDCADRESRRWGLRSASASVLRVIPHSTPACPPTYRTGYAETAARLARPPLYAR